MAGPARAGLFLYALDLERIAAFYEAVAGFVRLHAAADIVVLQSPDVQLVVHRIPPAIAAGITISSPPQRREQAALKFFFTVPSLAAAGRTIAALGGRLFDERWQGPGFVVCNAMDAEGNVFQIREAASAAASRAAAS